MAGINWHSNPDPKRGATLHEAAMRWPTPNTRDEADTARETTTTGVMHPGATLLDATRRFCSPQDPTTSRAGDDGASAVVLNPAFVETLMGLPVGWTLVDDADAFEALEMGLCPGRQLRLFEP